MTEISTMGAPTARRQPSPMHGEAKRFEVHQQVGDNKEHERRSHRQVAPVVSGDDFAGGDGEERALAWISQTREVHRGREL